MFRVGFASFMLNGKGMAEVQKGDEAGLCVGVFK